MNGTQLPSSGYYTVTLHPVIGRYVLRSNSERAFVMSCLQTTLTKRSLIEAPQGRRHLAAHIDLLAYSIQSKAITLIVFVITKAAARALAEIVSTQLLEYQSEWHHSTSSPRPSHGVRISRLAGPHTALSASVSLHLEHTDWEYDRYSSIGFYLHDRRGDWMTVWRIAALYEYDSVLYRRLLTETATLHTAITKQLSAPL